MTKVDSIKIRMYNTGSVGDCLLLLFQKNKVTTFSMLIDCGGFNTSTAAITACAQDIKTTLNGNPIDLVVVTHEHLDHVSGFNQARSVFDTLTFKQVWMAWTEDPKDALAKKLKATLGKKLAALTAALKNSHQAIVSRMASVPKGTSLRKRLEHYEQNWSDVIDALHFESGLAKGVRGQAAAATYTVPQAMTYVKGKTTNKVFRKPGEVVNDLKGAEGIRFHILGPPYDADLSGIKNKLEEDEMYSFTSKLSFAARETFLNAVEKNPSAEVSASPFNKKYRLNQKEEKEFMKAYDGKDMKWRQIEEDWMDAAGDIAAAVNTYTNNTSLAMAIEFADSGKVLLFPADAQSGNWISWHNDKVMQDLKKNGGKDTDELLANTIFYKVGHHGSHNGTASKLGLDKVKGSPLVAMMPLIQDKVPSQWGGSKNFPAKALYTELIKRTNGAIIRTDEGLIKDARAVALRKNLPAALKTKLNNVSANPLYQEWEVE